MGAQMGGMPKWGAVDLVWGELRLSKEVFRGCLNYKVIGANECL